MCWSPGLLDLSGRGERRDSGELLSMEEARLDNSTIEGIREVRGFIKLVEGELVGLEGELGGDLVGAVGARGGG